MVWSLRQTAARWNTIARLSDPNAEQYDLHTRMTHFPWSFNIKAPVALEKLSFFVERLRRVGPMRFEHGPQGIHAQETRHVDDFSMPDSCAHEEH